MTTKRRARIAGLALAVACLAAPSLPAAAAASEADWPSWATPEEAGFSSQRIAEAERRWSVLDPVSQAALFVAYKGKLLVAFGDSSEPYMCPAVRASLLSTLYGVHVDNGNLDLRMTLEQLGINDHPPLTSAELQARIVHLLQARSGVYHAAACESQSMRNARPPRGSHAPGTYWHLNNWDVNALGTILWRETGAELFEEFERRIARPLGMQDFAAADCDYTWELSYSNHPCYWFHMSVRDRARIGQLFLQRGRWGSRQVLSEAWIDESTREYSQSGTPGLGFGYMWWTLAPEFFERVLADPALRHLRGFAATNFGSQLILVLPDAEIVVAMGADSKAGFALVDAFPILERIVGARASIDLMALRPRVKPRRARPGAALTLAVKAKNRSAGAAAPTRVDFYLSPQRSLGDEVSWIGATDLPGLEARAKKVLRWRASVPAEIEPGEYYVIAAVDRDKANYDLRRDNNVAISRTTLRIEAD